MARGQELFDAVKRGDGPAVADFLRSEPELIRFADEYRKSALHWLTTYLTTVRQ